VPGQRGEAAGDPLDLPLDEPAPAAAAAGRSSEPPAASTDDEWAEAASWADEADDADRAATAGEGATPQPPPPPRATDSPYPEAAAPPAADTPDPETASAAALDTPSTDTLPAPEAAAVTAPDSSPTDNPPDPATGGDQPAADKSGADTAATAPGSPPTDNPPDPATGGDGPATDAAGVPSPRAEATAAADVPAQGGTLEDELDLIAAYPTARPGGTGAIHGIGLTVLVTNLGRSIDFYRDLLGFAEIDSGDGNAILASGDTRIVLREIPEVSPVNRRLVHLNLEVGDVFAVYEDLRSKGVQFTSAPRAVNRGAKLELWAAAFRDPDGHGIALTQWRSRVAQ
jgi:catechol 2,3-dioxygenase-like lactoylglutathione lyase family enzyme